MRKSLLPFVTLICSVGIAQAQSVLRGVVTSAEDKEPVVGATVVVKGNNKLGAVTDIDGKFSLNAPAGSTLVVSYVGMKTREVVAKGNLKIELVPENKDIDDVIVVAYSTARKSSFTGATSVLDSKKLEKAQVADVSKALEGMVPGLQVSSSSGTPGAGTSIRVRGIGSLNASSEPLIIVDGSPYLGSLSSINSNDIASLNVLKDAASSALYGARGANGVILITTKKGREGNTSVSLDMRLGINQRGVPEYDIVTDPGQYYQLYWEALKNYQLFSSKPLSDQASRQWATDNLIDRLGYNIYSGVADNEVVDVDGQLTPNRNIRYVDGSSFNDWAKLLYKPQLRQEYNLSMTRGTHKNNVYFSLGYLDDKGFNINSGFERMSSRMNFDSQFFPFLKVTSGTQLVYTKANYVAGGSASHNTFHWTRTIAPIYPVYAYDAQGQRIKDSFGDYVYDDGGNEPGVHKPRPFNANSNLIAAQKLNQDNTRKTSLTQNLRLDIDLPLEIKFNTTATYSSVWAKNIDYKNPRFGSGASYNGLVTEERYQEYSLNWNQVLQWGKRLSDFNFGVLLGHESFWRVTDYLEGSKTNLLDPLLVNLSNAVTYKSLTSYALRYAIEGYFSQFTVDYRNKYYLSGSVRRDASSSFAPEHRWGTFWSLGASWRIKQESFLKGVKAVNDLKLRASYGLQGNDHLLLPGSSSRAYTPYEDLYSVTSDGINAQLSPKYKGNREVTWEKNLNFDLGLEFRLWNGLLSGEADFFVRHTRDMLFNVPISSVGGFETEPINVGNMRNVGLEFSLNSLLYHSDKVSVSVGLNGSSYKNKMLHLPDQFRENGITKDYQIIKEGGSIYDFYLVRYAGVNPENGDALYYIYDEATDSYVAKGSDSYRASAKDKQFVGSAIPKIAGGFNVNVNAYNFDFAAVFSYSLGAVAYDGVYAGLMGRGEAGYNWHKDVLNYWTPSNSNTTVPRVQDSYTGANRTSDRFLRSADNLALKSISLGYSLPNALLHRAHLKKLRLYIAADNLFLLSAKKGFDPRTQLNGTQSYSVNSVIRTVSVGMNVGI